MVSHGEGAWSRERQYALNPGWLTLCGVCFGSYQSGSMDAYQELINVSSRCKMPIGKERKSEKEL